MENRNKSLEEIRRQSLEKWAQEQRRALNEATKNTPVNDRNAAASSSTVAGGSFSSAGSVARVHTVVFSDSSDSNTWKYMQYFAATATWAEPKSLGFNTTACPSLQNTWPTNGYGCLLEFQSNPGDRRQVYIDVNGDVTWDSGDFIEYDQYDIDSEDEALGLITFFSGNLSAGTFQIRAFYKDKMTVFDFDNYIDEGVSTSLSEQVYEDKVIYTYGTSSTGRQLYSLDLLTGQKTLLATVPANGSLSTGSYTSTYGNPNTIYTAADVIFCSVEDAGGNLLEFKLIDHSGNVLTDIYAQLLELGEDPNTIDDWYRYGSGYTTHQQAGCFLLVILDGNSKCAVVNANSGILNVFPISLANTAIFQGLGRFTTDNFIISVDLPGGGSFKADMLFPDVSGEQSAFIIINSSGDTDTVYFNEGVTLFKYYIDSDNNLTVFTVESGVLSLVKINCDTFTVVDTPLSTSIYNDPGDYFEYNLGYTPSGLGEGFFLANDSSNADVTGYYLQDNYPLSLVHSGVGGGYAYYLNDYNYRAPAAYVDSVTSELYLIDRATRTASEHPVPIVYGWNYDWQVDYATAYTTRVDYSNDTWYVISDGQFLTGSLPTGTDVNVVHTSEDYILVQGDDGTYYIYSRQTGAFISDITVNYAAFEVPDAGILISNDNDDNSPLTWTATTGSASVTSQTITFSAYGGIWNDVFWWNW